MERKRQRFNSENKVEILREHFKNKVPISGLCEKYGTYPCAPAGAVGRRDHGRRAGSVGLPPVSCPLTPHTNLLH